MRRTGVHPVVIKDTHHHTKVDLAMNVYHKASAEDIRDGLRVVTRALLGADLLPEKLLPALRSALRARVRHKFCACHESGERGRNRTFNLLIKSRTLS